MTASETHTLPHGGSDDLMGPCACDRERGARLLKSLLSRYLLNRSLGEQSPSIRWQNNSMCRNIKTLHNFKPPATDEEIRASSLQFVRKLSGFTKPSKANELAFNEAVDQVAQAARDLLQSLVTNAPPRDREVEVAKARARAADRFASADVGSAS